MPTVLPREEEVNGVTNNSLEPNVNHTNETQNIMKRGLMVATCVRWRNWQPGNEYIKYVLMKNTQLNVQRITYKIPESKYFTTLYPKQITLNPGNSYSLPITFHPQEKKVYEDVVKCNSNNGDFEVKLVGCLPVTKVEFPDSLVLPRCSLHGSTEKSFILKNTGETVISVKWLFAEPFEIKPEECMVDPGSSCSFKVIFQPKFAKLYEGMMICQFSSDAIKYKKMKVVAQGKYPHLIVSNSESAEKAEECVDGMQTIVCFDDVAVGFSQQKNITLKNVSLVEIPFKIHYPLKESAFRLDAAFDLPIKNGVIPPLSSTELPIIFHPSIVDTNYIEYFHVLPIGGLTRNVIKCVGNTIGPKMSLEPESIDFSRIILGEASTSSVELINQTDVPAYYQFVIDAESSCFKLSSVSGLVKPHSSQQVSIKFKPAFAMNYYRRITCLIHNQEPLFLDLLGTCHSEFVKPAVLRMDHVKSFEIRSKQGFAALPPDQLNELLINKAMKLSPDGRVLVPERSIDDVENNHRNSIAVYFASNPSTEECMNHEYDPPVTLDITCADFGRCTSLRTTVEKTLCITNTTRGKVCVQWTPGKEKIFTVHPSFMEIPSLKSGAFKVLFNPEMQNQFYGTTLECHIFYKCMLDYRFIPDETFCPPWCFSLSCTGHTFSPESETFLAKKVILDKTDICFPSTSLEQASYKTFMIFNTGKTPLFYEFDIDHSETFCIKPNRGLIQSGHQIFVARFFPKEKKLYDQVLNVRFNYTSKRSKALRFIGICEDPEILLDNRGEIYFKQTCIGTSSTSQYSFKNMTQKILNFEWKIKRSDEKEIAMLPCSGQIMPNDTFNHVCVFSPVHAGRKIFKWNLFIWSEDALEKLSQLQVRAFGTATSGEIMVETSYYNFGDVVVGRLSQYNIVLMNTGTCNLVYKLLVRQTVDDEEMQYPEEIAIHLSEWQIDMPAKSKQIVRATVRPSCQASYRFAIAYQLVLDEDQVKDPSLLEPKHLCHLLMNGVFPSLIVTDIRGLGNSKEISKRQLWTLFSLDCLNSYFSSDPSYQELMLSMETHKTTERRPSFTTQAIVDFNFSAAPLHSQPSTFILQLENNGTVPAEWAFLFPDDMKLEVETWGDSGDLNDEDLHQMKVLENKLFTVEPKNLRLEPGEGTAVTLTYNHMLTGTDHLNVLLKVVDGREILLNFVGVTVEPERPYIHFHSNRHTFLPMPVGKIYHPKQIYELYNGGACIINYKVDVRPLIQLEKQNYNHTIFECMNPCGSLSPGKSAFLEWKFSPLECMTYTVDIPIHIEGGETAVITFVGIGYDAEVMGQTMALLDTTLNVNIPDSLAPSALPEQIVGLSKERISLGNIPMFAMKCGLVFVNNRSTDHQVSFNWKFASPADEQLLSVNPVKGLLQPKEGKLCQLSFMDCGLPGFYDIDLICEITDDTEVEKYKLELKLWEKEMNRQQMEFTLTEKNLDAVTPEMNDVELLVSPGRICPFISLSDESSFKEEQMVAYRTLPPIRRVPMDKQMETFRHTKKFQKKKYWKKPQPPESSILHLGITARTYDVEEFEVNNPEEYRYFFLDKMFGKSSKLNLNGESEKYVEERIICSDLHRDMLCEVMSNIIRALLVDTYFHDALKSIQYEDVPYYQQFVQEVQTRHLNNLNLEKKINVDRLSSQSNKNRSCPSPLIQSMTVSTPVSNIVDGADKCTGMKEKTKEVDAKEADTEMTLEEKEKVKHLDEFSSILDSFLGSCVLGIMEEAMNREFNLTAPSRFIALPKKPNTASPSTTQ